MVMQMIEWTGVMTDEEMLLNRRQADACKEEYCEEEAVEGGGHIVATEGEQDDVDQGCEDPADSLTSQNLKTKAEERLLTPARSSLRSCSGWGRHRQDLSGRLGRGR